MIGNPFKRLRARSWNRIRGWKFSGATIEGETLSGWPFDFWQHTWVDTGTRAELRDPLYGQRRMVRCWYVEVDGTRHAFAADEFSNGVWGFFLPV